VLFMIDLFLASADLILLLRKTILFICLFW
jgi:hypothetical protein